MQGASSPCSCTRLLELTLFLLLARPQFLHDRGDYMHGWQLDNSFLSNSTASGSFMAKQRARDGGDAADSDSDSDADDLPFACLICRKPFGNEPVVTLCGHYFDSTCAIKRYVKTGKCFACGAATNGVFNRCVPLSLSILLSLSRYLGQGT